MKVIVDGNADKSFIVGIADTIRDNKIGSCWWAGAFAPGGSNLGHHSVGP
jgi:hypothetical protein